MNLLSLGVMKAQAAPPTNPEREFLSTPEPPEGVFRVIQMDDGTAVGLDSNGLPVYQLIGYDGNEGEAGSWLPVSSSSIEKNGKGECFFLNWDNKKMVWDRTEISYPEELEIPIRLEWIDHLGKWVGFDEDNRPISQSYSMDGGGEWEKHVRELRFLCQAGDSQYNMPSDCDLLTEEMTRPIDPATITIKPLVFTDSQGNMVELENGRVPQLDSEYYDEKGMLINRKNAVAGIIRGVIDWDYLAGENTVKIVIEVPLSDLESQVIFFVIPDQGYVPMFKVLDKNLGAEGEITYSHSTTSPKDMLVLLEKYYDQWIGQQIIFTFQSESIANNHTQNELHEQLLKALNSRRAANIFVFLSGAELYLPQSLVPAGSYVK
jgi:hypothetical protein